jgi:hypothetical protein
VLGISQTVNSAQLKKPRVSGYFIEDFYGKQKHYFEKSLRLF